MELGDPTATTREQRSRLDVALDTFENSLADLIGTFNTGGLDQLSAEEKVAVWRRFEAIRNRQPLVDPADGGEDPAERLRLGEHRAGAVPDRLAPAAPVRRRR